MGISAQERKMVEGVFKAMQNGPGAEEAMMALFDDAAVFIEPFSGEPQTHVGKDAIRGSFRDQWKNPLPDFKLTLDRVDLDRPQVRAEWTCHVLRVSNTYAWVRFVHAERQRKNRALRNHCH